MDNLEIDYKKAAQQLRSGEALFPDFVIVSPQKSSSKKFCYFLMPCHQHGLGVNLIVQR